jgi:hypothetical protein
MSTLPSPLAKAMLVPLGDQAGVASLTELLVSRFATVQAVFRQLSPAAGMV